MGLDSLKIYSGKPERFDYNDHSDINYLDVDKKSTDRVNLMTSPKQPVIQRQLTFGGSNLVTMRPQSPVAYS